MTRSHLSALHRELLAAPPTVTLDLSNKALGISKSHGYELARSGRYPVRVLRLGASYRVVTAELLELLGLAHTAPSRTGGAA
jgi:hypothetical protein